MGPKILAPAVGWLATLTYSLTSLTYNLASLTYNLASLTNNHASLILGEIKKSVSTNFLNISRNLEQLFVILANIFFGPPFFKEIQCWQTTPVINFYRISKIQVFKVSQTFVKNLKFSSNQMAK